MHWIVAGPLPAGAQGQREIDMQLVQAGVFPGPNQHLRITRDGGDGHSMLLPVQNWWASRGVHPALPQQNTNPHQRQETLQFEHLAAQF